MSEHNTHDVVGHEETDADIAPLVKFAIFLTVVTLVTAALTAGFYKYLDSREQAEKAPRYPLAQGVERPLPPAPRLQTYPFDDVKGLRREEAQLLEHYPGSTRTPAPCEFRSSRAIELLADKGLPHRAAAPAAGAPAPAPAAAAPPAAAAAGRHDAPAH